MEKCSQLEVANNVANKELGTGMRHGFTTQIDDSIVSIRSLFGSLH